MERQTTHKRHIDSNFIGNVTKTWLVEAPKRCSTVYQRSSSTPKPTKYQPWNWDLQARRKATCDLQEHPGGHVIRSLQLQWKTSLDCKNKTFPSSSSMFSKKVETYWTSVPNSKAKFTVMRLTSSRRMINEGPEKKQPPKLTGSFANPHRFGHFETTTYFLLSQFKWNVKRVTRCCWCRQKRPGKQITVQLEVMLWICSVGQQFNPTTSLL